MLCTNHRVLLPVGYNHYLLLLLSLTFLLMIIINKLILPTNLTTIHYHRALIRLVHVPRMNRCNMRFALWKNGFNIVIGHHVVSCGESMPGPHSSITSFCATSAPYPRNMDHTFTCVFFLLMTGVTVDMYHRHRTRPTTLLHTFRLFDGLYST